MTDFLMSSMSRFETEKVLGMYSVLVGFPAVYERAVGTI